MIRPLRKWMRVLLLVINIMVAVCLVASAYAGMLSPDVTVLAGIVAMTFVLWLLIAVMLIVADLLIYRRMVWLPVVAMAVCFGPIRTYCPVNIHWTSATAEEKSGTFTVLNYNIEGYHDDLTDPEASENRTVSFILETDADIVCLQECSEFRPMPDYGLTQAQLDSMVSRYPYHEWNAYGEAIFSKYPFSRIDLPTGDIGAGDFQAYSIMVEGHPLTVFNVHLQSIGLTDDDKKLYLELTRDPTENKLRQAKTQLFAKLCHGFRQRAIQARILSDYIGQIGGNVIVCGDFNDVPGCYAIRTLEKLGLRDAYTDAAFGPAITYHVNRFYFRIDQALYRGSFKAVDIQCHKVPSSDHYPLLTTYRWNA